MASLLGEKNVIWVCIDTVLKDFGSPLGSETKWKDADYDPGGKKSPKMKKDYKKWCPPSGTGTVPVQQESNLYNLGFVNLFFAAENIFFFMSFGSKLFSSLDPDLHYRYVRPLGSGSTSAQYGNWIRNTVNIMHIRIIGNELNWRHYQYFKT